MTGPFTTAVVIPDPDAPPAPAGVITVDDFWPELNLDQLKKAIRIDGAVSPERLRDVATHAVLEVARELSVWRADQVAAGHASLADVPSDLRIGDENHWAILWTRAVHSAVAADLAERQLGQSARAAGVDRADDFETDIDVHRRNLRYAIRDFLGRSRIIAEAL